MSIAEIKGTTVALGTGDIGVVTDLDSREVAFIELLEPEEIGSCKDVFLHEPGYYNLDKPVVVLKFTSRDSLDVVLNALVRMRFEWIDD